MSAQIYTMRSQCSPVECAVKIQFCSIYSYVILKNLILNWNVQYSIGRSVLDTKTVKKVYTEKH